MDYSDYVTYCVMLNFDAKKSFIILLFIADTLVLGEYAFDDSGLQCNAVSLIQSCL